jgi:hypothetical protein
MTPAVSVLRNGAPGLSRSLTDARCGANQTSIAFEDSMIAFIHNFALAAADIIGPPTALPPPGPLDNLRAILSKPDNIPIMLMVILVGFFTGMAMRDARKHDRLIREGRKSEILKMMQD